MHATCSDQETLAAGTVSAEAVRATLTSFSGRFEPPQEIGEQPLHHPAPKSFQALPARGLHHSLSTLESLCAGAVAGKRTGSRVLVARTWARQRIPLTQFTA